MKHLAHGALFDGILRHRGLPQREQRQRQPGLLADRQRAIAQRGADVFVCGREGAVSDVKPGAPVRTRALSQTGPGSAESHRSSDQTRRSCLAPG